MNNDARQIAGVYHRLRTLAERDEAKAITVRTDDMLALLNAYRLQKNLLMRLHKCHALEKTGWPIAIGEALTDKMSNEQPAFTAFLNVYDNGNLRHQSLAAAQDSQLAHISGGRCIEVCFYGTGEDLHPEVRVLQNFQHKPIDKER